MGDARKLPEFDAAIQINDHEASQIVLILFW